VWLTCSAPAAPHGVPLHPPARRCGATDLGAAAAPARCVARLPRGAAPRAPAGRAALTLRRAARSRCCPSMRRPSTDTCRSCAPRWPTLHRPTSTGARGLSPSHPWGCRGCMRGCVPPPAHRHIVRTGAVAAALAHPQCRSHTGRDAMPASAVSACQPDVAAHLLAGHPGASACSFAQAGDAGAVQGAPGDRSPAAAAGARAPPMAAAGRLTPPAGCCWALPAPASRAPAVHGAGARAAQTSHAHLGMRNTGLRLCTSCPAADAHTSVSYGCTPCSPYLSFPL